MLDTESQESYADCSWPLRTSAGRPLRRAGAAGAPRRDRYLAASAAVSGFLRIALAYAASVLMFYVFARYRSPLVPMLMLFAGGRASILAL